MSSLYYDTGVLLKLYTEEPESSRVRSFVRRERRALAITDLHLSEAVSALRLKAFRRECTPTQCDAAIACLEEDLGSRILRLTALDWAAAWQGCQLLARTEAGVFGTRTLDTLHVACALQLHVEGFVTTDHRQGGLAQRCGLRVVNPLAQKPVR